SGSTQTITFSGCAGLIQLSGSGGGMVWPVGGAGVPNYSGTNSWGTSYSASNTLPENFLPAATVFTDQNATFGAPTYDFSGMTLGKWRLSAGLTTSANGDFGYDSTNSNWHFWYGADSIVAPLASGFVSCHCGQPTSSAGKWVIADTGAACGTSSGANPALSNLASVSINTALLFQTGVDVGSATNPLRNLYLFGSGTYGTTSFEFTGTPTAARVVTFPDATDTVVELTQTQILTNKSMSGASNTFTNIPLSAFTNLGTTTTVLHGNAAGSPSFGAVDLANDITGNLGVSHLNSGTGASSSTFWRGDGTWATPSASVPSGTFQTNGVNNTTSTSQNLITSTTNADGLTVTPSNPGTNQEKMEITGTYTGSVGSVTGTLPCGAMPALTGHVTTPGGSCATTVSLTIPMSCEIVWGGTGTSNALQSGDDAIANQSCYNKKGVTETITAVYCRSDAASNTT